MSLRKGLIAFVLAAVTAMAADQVLPTPYDLIRPVWPLTWDSTIFNTNFTAGPNGILCRISIRLLHILLTT